MGNLISRNFDPSTDLVDLHGKVAIVTGGNTGIGYATVLHLARSGAKVYLAARDESRAIGAISRLQAEGLSGGEVIWLKLDLSDPRDAQKSAEDFLRRERRLDILVNNAGMVSAPFEKNSDGLSTMATVNYISPFVFTRALLPLLTETAKEPQSDVRIVNVASIVHRLISSSVTFKKIEDFNVTYRFHILPGLTRYAHSKFMAIMWTRSLQKRLDAADPLIPITAIAIHPGGVDTFTHTWPFPRFSRWLVGLVIADPVRGAYNSAFAAASKKIADNRNQYKAAYLESQPTGRITKLGRLVSDDALAEQLWGTTERYLEQIGL